MDVGEPTHEPQQPSRWPGVYWLMSQDFKQRYGSDACKPPPPGTARRKQSPPAA